MHIWYGMVIFYLHNIIENILTKHKKYIEGEYKMSGDNI